MVLLSPSMVTDAVPIVRMPVILASPLTSKAVVAAPVLTSTPLLNVERPSESTCLTSS